MGSCQNHGPFLGALNSRCRIIIGTQKGTIILTTTHMIEKGFVRNVILTFCFVVFYGVWAGGVPLLWVSFTNPELLRRVRSLGFIKEGV